MNDNKSETGGVTSHKVCGVCGQVFALDDVDQIFHHDGEPHEPSERTA